MKTTGQERDFPPHITVYTSFILSLPINSSRPSHGVNYQIHHEFVLLLSPGEIHVWNTGVEGDPRLASSGFTDLGHKEPVAKVVVITLLVGK